MAKPVSFNQNAKLLPYHSLCPFPICPADGPAQEAPSREPVHITEGRPKEQTLAEDGHRGGGLAPNLTRRAAEDVEHWGPFTLAWFPPSSDNNRPYGACEARCPFHAKNKSTKCKKYYSLRSDDPSHREEVRWRLRHWCNQGLQHSKQREHLGGRGLKLSDRPDNASIIAASLTQPAPAAEEIMTDAQQDAQAAGQELLTLICSQVHWISQAKKQQLILEMRPVLLCMAYL